MESVAFSADGPSGEMYCGYQKAVSFGPWRLTARTRDIWSVVAEDAAVHGYWALHGSSTLRVRLCLGPPGWWEADAEILGTVPLRIRGLGPVVPIDR